MSRPVNAPRTAPRSLRQPRTADRPWPIDPDSTAVLRVDLREAMPSIAGGGVTRAWLLLHVGPVPVGGLLVRVPPEGLSAKRTGALIADRVARRDQHRSPWRRSQWRLRRRGRTSVL